MSLNFKITDQATLEDYFNCGASVLQDFVGDNGITVIIDTELQTASWSTDEYTENEDYYGVIEWLCIQDYISIDKKNELLENFNQ